jgi:cytochrome c556
MRNPFHALLMSMLILAVAAAACRSQPPEPVYTPTATVKDLMQGLIDKSADDVWLSVTTVHSEQGVVETRPQNDEEWLKVRHGALALAEAANLLMIPGRRVARPGEKSETPGVELEPEEMDELIAKDPAGWYMRSQALRSAALATLKAVDAKDADKVFELGEQIEHACEGCHSHYWYPNEKIPELSSDSAPASTSP